MIESMGAAGFVLAGGQSLRMGSDKAMLAFAGQPLIQRAVGILEQAGLQAMIVGERADLGLFAPIVEDQLHAQGPLGGVCAALEGMDGRWGVFLPVDVPLLPACLLAYLLQHSQGSGAAVTIASVSGIAQTFPAVIDRSVLPGLHAELEAGRRKCIQAFEVAAAALGGHMAILPVEPLAESGKVTHPAGLSPEQWFLNVNTPIELRTAESLALR